MNRPLYKPFFVYSLLLPLALSLFAATIYPRESQIISSSERDCRFVVRFERSLSDLDLVPVNDSTVRLSATVMVAMPVGASARLVSAEPSEPTPIEVSLSKETRIDYSQPVVELQRPIMVRGRQLLPVTVSPVAGGAVYTQVEIALAFDGGLMDGIATADPFFERVVGGNVVNLDQALQLPTQRNVAAKPAATNGPFSDAPVWLKLDVTSTGLHAVTGAQLAQAGVVLGSFNSDDLRLFNGGGQPLPVYNEIDRPEFEEIPIIVDDGGDGVFEANDRFLFFGEAVDRWIYEAGSVVYYLNNVYTNENTYWLAVGGSFTDQPARIASISGDLPSADTTVTEFLRRVRAEQDNVLLRESDGHIDSYYDWFWTDQTELSFYVPTSGAVLGDTARVRVNARTSGSSSTTGYVDLTINQQFGPDSKSCNALNCTFLTTALSGGLDEFAFTMQPIDNETPPYFNYIELEYTSRLEPSGNRLDITLGGYDGPAELQVIDNFTADPIILDLADPSQPVQIAGFTRGGGVLTFDAQLQIGSPNRFFLGTPGAADAVSSITLVSPNDLRVAGSQADMVIVTPEGFVSRLDEYIALREADGYSIEVVTVEDIMDNFSWGLYDPTAIRDFLKYAYETWPAPAPHTVLFVGDANYDFLDALGTGQPNYVPAYIHSLLRSEDRAYSDDNYVYFGDYGILDSDTSFITPDRGYDMMTARWPVSSGAQIDVIVDKIKSYETGMTFGSWRNRITYVADDEFGTFDNVPEPFHVTQTEILENDYTPAHYERKKIYLWEFPVVNGRKPACNEAIVDAFNDGSLIVNYVGHGNPDVWAHERVLLRQTDLPRLTNRDRLPLVVAASCAIGFFDDPLREGMGEALLAMSGGGAIGVLSATRLVYSQDNALFNRAVYNVMLNSDSLSMCEAVYTAKLLKQYGNRDYPIPLTNDRAYVFFGDPLLKLGAPSGRIEFDEAPDSLAALERAGVSGRLVDRFGMPVTGDGRIEIAVFDSERPRAYELAIGGGDMVEYELAGASIYRGSAALTSGEFSFEFVTPLDIGFGGSSARIMVYAVVDDSNDAVGVVDSLAVSDVVAETTDSTGPEITVTVAGRSGFQNGDVVSVNDMLDIRIADSSGINLATELGHGITLEVDDDVESMQNLTDRFTYDQDDYTAGSLRYSVEDLGPGMHTIRVKAWDNANNSSSISFSIEVVSSASLAIQDLLNYPNPTADVTTFFFELTQPVSLFNLDIYTLSGRKIKSLERRNVPVGSHEIYWDGRDADGDRPATGVYIYKATAVPASGGDGVESFGKIVVVN
ncbi:type IX secretion system sortase PorU [candidate division GN15 bacterium]|nr:type IX secretion system sortase PorU [candidate division GN15 bacterium]